MALKNLFDMVKADRYTQDGRETLIKAQEAETEDAKEKPEGSISPDGKRIKQSGKWVPRKNAKQPGIGSKATEETKTGVPIQGSNWMSLPSGTRMTFEGAKEKMAKNNERIETIKKMMEGKSRADNFRLGSELKSLQNEHEYIAERLPPEKTESPSASGSAPSTIKYEDAQKAINNGQVVQWKDSDGVWHDVDPKTSELVMARDIGSKLRVKTDENGNPVKAKPEPGMDETRSKLLELEKRRKKFEKYPDMDNSIKLEQAALLSKAGFESRAEFEDFVKSEMPNDAAPRVLTGDTRIRVRKV